MSTKLLEGGAEDFTEADFTDITDLQGDIDAQLETVIGEFAGETDLKSKIKIYQLKNGKMGWAFDCLPSELPVLDRIRDIYGPGDYVSRIYVGKSLKRALEFSIAAPRRINQQETIQPKQTGDVSALADVIKESIGSLKGLIAENNRQTQPNMIEMQTQFINQMVAMKQLFESKNQGNNLQLSDLKDMLSLVEELRGEKTEEPMGAMGLLNNMVEKVLPALTHNVEKNRAYKGENRVQDQPDTKANKQTQNTGDNSKMKMQLIYLCTMAAKDADPYIYGNLIIDQCNEQQLAQIMTLLKSGDWFEQLANFHDGIISHKNWFAELRDCILSEVIDTSEITPDTVENVNQEETIAENVHSSTENENNNNPEPSP